MLDLAPIWAVKASWIVFLAYWTIAALKVKPMRRREDVVTRALDSALFLLVAFLLLARGLLPEFLLARFFAPGLATGALGAALTAAGIALAIWARLHLGREWSGTVALKDTPVLIRSGPYAVLRHPIYSGLLLALLGTALAQGEWRGLAALVLAFAAILRRVAAEEALLCHALPGYERYRAESWALIPFLY